MNDRMKSELELLGKSYSIEHLEDGMWIFLREFVLPAGKCWNPSTVNVCFEIPLGYPATPPDGFYIPVGTRCDGKVPASYSEPAPKAPPFQGQWGFFSWHLESGWKATASIKGGSNLLDFVWSIRERFSQGA